MQNKKLNKLNCMNYHVTDLTVGDTWFAWSGLRSLYTYSKISDTSFKKICIDLLEVGQTEIIDTRPDYLGHKLVLTMI
jgi:hypothetical protein